MLVRAPPVTLLPEARYDEVMTAFGGRGFLVRTVEELRSALELSLSDWERPSLLNVLIDPSSDRKQQVTVICLQYLCVWSHLSHPEKYRSNWKNPLEFYFEVEVL